MPRRDHTLTLGRAEGLRETNQAFRVFIGDGLLQSVLCLPVVFSIGKPFTASRTTAVRSIISIPVFKPISILGGSFFVGATHVGNQAGENPSTGATPLGVLAQVSFYAPTRAIANLGGSY